jgi:deoxyribodipyrimidine photo-lyase
MPSNELAVFWFRRDLRFHDHAGLFAALNSGLPVLPVFIFDKNILNALDEKKDARVAFIHRQLSALDAQLRAQGSGLLVLYDEPIDAWNMLLSKFNIKQVYTSRDYEPYALERDESVRKILELHGVAFHQKKDQVIFEQDEVVKDDGNPYTVFTPYSKKWKLRMQQEGIPSFPSELHTASFLSWQAPPLPTLEEIGFEPVDAEFPLPEVGDDLISHYAQRRDIPSVRGTSRLSVHLRFGTVSVRQLAKRALNLSETYLNELIWREFYMQILWHFPRVVNHAFKPAYDHINWRNEEALFMRWCEGKTGYPIVDAGMRELNATGFMHNRVRMIVASFLCKNLLIDWRWGERYFAAKLLDFELASNNGGWQWAAGSGVDAAPYFRVFNPTLQTQRFDPQGAYIRKWVPEYGTPLYPRPIVDFSESRKRCLEVYKAALT